MLYNKTKKRRIIGKVRIAGSSFARFKGLMFERQENFDYALIFPLPYESRIGASVHMLFVFFPIDIFFLDSGKKVVDKATLRPWTLNYTPRQAAKYLVEMPAGTLGKIKLGDKLKWASGK